MAQSALIIGEYPSTDKPLLNTILSNVENSVCELIKLVNPQIKLIIRFAIIFSNFPAPSILFIASLAFSFSSLTFSLAGLESTFIFVVLFHHLSLLHLHKQFLFCVLLLLI
ncbi:hypothetical protein NPD8_3894 (plasmid) [Clostridium botulinum]|uniref:Uncharacterized protein n=1 Tax=Clostridium botulinum TaxID=1491 RepID=A0A1L7JN77_CLOBO|nr:hypothetical protein NPD8_3894 [Clostridium botulinum]